MMKRDGRSDGFLEDLECWILGLAAKDLIKESTKNSEEYVMPTKQQPIAAAFFIK